MPFVRCSVLIRGYQVFDLFHARVAHRQFRSTGWSPSELCCRSFVSLAASGPTNCDTSHCRQANREAGTAGAKKRGNYSQQKVVSYE